MTLTIYKETTWQRRLTVRDAAGDPFPLDTTTLDVLISKHSPGPAVVTLAPGSGITLADQLTEPGVALIEILPILVSPLALGAYVIAIGGTRGSVRQIIMEPMRIMLRDPPG